MVVRPSTSISRSRGRILSNQPVDHSMHGAEPALYAYAPFAWILALTT